LAVVLSLSAIAMLFYQTPPRKLASDTSTTNTTQGQTPTSPQLNSGNKQSLKTPSAVPSDQNSSNTNSGTSAPNSNAATNANTAGSSSATTPANIDVTLSTDNLTLAADNTSPLVTATTSDNSNLTWSVTPDSTNTGISAIFDQTANNAHSFAVRFRANTNVPAGQYQFSVVGKDATRGVSISKVITVTVPAA